MNKPNGSVQYLFGGLSRDRLLSKSQGGIL
jgi:hypothetical protein